jgi:hypothetical protein
MSIDISPLLEPLVRGTTDDLESLDDRLIAIDEYAAQGHFDEAATACQELLAAGIYDLRPLPYALHSAFLDEGGPGIDKGLRVLENLLGPSRPALSPSKRQDHYINKRLAWLFDSIEKAIQYHRERSSEQWERLRASLSEQSLDAALAACGRLDPLLAAEGALDAVRALGQLVVGLRSLRNCLPTGGVSVEATTQSQATREEPVPGTTAASRERPELTSMQIRVAQPFVDLCHQLGAVQRLLDRDEHLKAAVVLESIQRALETFDPRSCFPELFASFAAGVAKHATALEQATGAQGSPVWQALAQYAKVDLAGFVESRS